MSSEVKTRVPRGFVIASCVLSLRLSLQAQVNVLTYHNDQARTGQNTNETVLTPGNVQFNSFGQLFSYAVDGQVYAQPLYVSGLVIPGRGSHNLIFIATQHDSLYAFDADNSTAPAGGLIWHRSLGTSAVTPNNDFGNRYGPYHDIDPEVGITGTPIIDLNSGTLYLDAFTHEGNTYLHRIHAVNITNGMEQPYSPVVVRASVAGFGVGSTNGILAFNAEQHLQRPGLTLAGGILYVAYSGYADTDPYHGWVIGFDAGNLQPLTNYVFNTTPNATTTAFGGNAGEGGIWMSGNGLSVDAQTNLFLEVGNGSFNANGPRGTEYGDSFIKLSTAGRLAVTDYFAPYNQASLAAADTDLGSGGPLLLPDSEGSPAHPHLLVGCGKEGKIYLLDRDNLGHFNSVNDSQIVQELPGAVGGTWSSPAYFNHQVYYHGNGDVLKAFKLANGLLVATPVSRSATSFGFPGATPAISANGTNNAIAWDIKADAYSSSGSSGPSVLHAYNAYNLAQELYNSSQAGTRDTLGGALKFTVPTIANGKVYVGAQNKVSVFGNASFSSLPAIHPAPGLFTNFITVSLSTSVSGATIFYTLDGSVPSTNSAAYTAPFVLTNTTAVSAIALKPGTAPSPVASGAFINSASTVLSTGFIKQEFYPGALRSSLENPSFVTHPSFVNFLTSLESPSGQSVNYAERLSGFFLPPQTADYIFFVASDDDADLFLSTDSTPANKHLIAAETVWSNSREWVSSSGGSVVASKRSDQFAGITWPTSHTIHLIAGFAYYIEAVHHQGTGGDNFAATFRMAGASDPVDGDAPKLFGSDIATLAYNTTYIAINAAPQNTAAVQGYSATFSVGAIAGYLSPASGAQPPAVLYQWQSAPAGSSAFTNIPNATQISFVTPPLSSANNGAGFQVVLTTPGSTATSSAAFLVVVPDATPPSPLRIVAVNPAATTVTVAFSEVLTASSAQTSSNYFFSPGNITITNAMLDATGTHVTLSSSGALPRGTPITLSMSGITDLAENPVAPNTTVTFSIGPGSGVAVTNLAISPSTLQFTSITAAGGQVVLQWSGNTSLQEASSVTGPWSLSPNQLNPQAVTASGTRFYRLIGN